MFVLKIGLKYVGEIIPKVTLVDFREDISKQCLFVDADEARTMVRLMCHAEETGDELVDPEFYSDARSKFSHCEIMEPDTCCNVEWDKVSEDDSDDAGFCDNCLIQSRALPLLCIGRGALCPFCLKQLGETAEEYIKQVPAAIADEYYAALVTKNLTSDDYVVTGIEDEDEDDF